MLISWYLQPYAGTFSQLMPQRWQIIKLESRKRDILCSVILVDVAENAFAKFSYNYFCTLTF